MVTKRYLLQKYKAAIVLVVALVLGTSTVAQKDDLLLNEDFDNGTGAWKPYVVDGASGLLNAAGDALAISLIEGGFYGAYYAQRTFSDHFEVEVDFDEQDGLGLGLIKAIDGVPSQADYSIITIVKNKQGTLEVRLTDKQNGQKDVFDFTGMENKDRYTHALTGNVYSVPFTTTAKKLKILRHQGERFLHFYYAVAKEIEGEVYYDWLELAPSQEWGISSDYFVALFALKDTISFNQVKVKKLSLVDKKDFDTGFSVTKRPYTWSGYTADATVVTFGKAFPFFKNDHKFVFWHLTNNVPVWHINGQSLFAHGFVETWNGGNPGCHEPMSDRLLAFSDIQVIEDNRVRKVVEWKYQLVDPNYRHPDYGKGLQKPEVFENYVIYADGSIVRTVKYVPKLDTDFRNWHELTELILIAGENHRPSELLRYPSLTFFESNEVVTCYNNEGETTMRNHNKHLGTVSMVAHVKNAPNLFYSFSDDPKLSEINSGHPFNYEITWHRRTNNFGHWPIAKQPYHEPFKSSSIWPEQVAHTSLIGMGIDQGQDWEQDYKVTKDGRKYRQWISLMGMNDSDNDITVLDKTNSWLFSGSMEVLDQSSAYLGYSFENKYFQFKALTENPFCHFKMSTKNKLVHPIFKITQWGQHPLKLYINNKPIKPSEFIASHSKKGDLLVLVLMTLQGEVNIQFSI